MALETIEERVARVHVSGEVLHGEILEGLGIAVVGTPLGGHLPEAAYRAGALLLAELSDERLFDPRLDRVEPTGKGEGLARCETEPEEEGRRKLGHAASMTRGGTGFNPDAVCVREIADVLPYARARFRG